MYSRNCLGISYLRLSDTVFTLHCLLHTFVASPYLLSFFITLRPLSTLILSIFSSPLSLTFRYKQSYERAGISISTAMHPLVPIYTCGRFCGVRKVEYSRRRDRVNAEEVCRFDIWRERHLPRGLVGLFFSLRVLQIVSARVGLRLAAKKRSNAATRELVSYHSSDTRN